MSDKGKINEALALINDLLKEGDQLRKSNKDEYRDSKIFLACEMLRMVKARLED